MRKISEIKCRNYRAYYDQYKIEIPNGANVLIYGENGSGKSSLFNMLRDFIRSSVETIEFNKNIYNTRKKGRIDIEFIDINTQSKKSYHFSDTDKNTEDFFLKQSTLTKAFLDYTDLLEVYLKSKTDLNLFNLIVLSLLKDIRLVSEGYTETISEIFLGLKNELLILPKTRNDTIHKNAKLRVPDFEKMLHLILKNVFKNVNYYLTKYFSYHDIEVSYDLKKMDFSYGNNSYKSNWALETFLSISIKKYNKDLGNNFKEYLNEARLSSVALCIYLASLKMYPEVSTNYKILYLDDVFVGIDTMNRLSIVDLIKKEFSDYQIFISTYDRSFFLACKERLKEDFSQEKWIGLEFFITNQQNVAHGVIEKPIIIKHDSELDKARYYLYNNFAPDYPASANYFRKFLEKSIIEVFPINFFKDDDLISIEAYKLTSIVGLSKSVLNELGYIIPEFDRVQSSLSILLHPLSHYNLSTNVYKNELMALDNSISFLFENQVIKNIVQNWLLKVGKNSTFRMIFTVNQYTYFTYDFHTNKNIFYCQNKNNWSKTKCICTRVTGVINKKEQKTTNLNKSTSKIKYNSIEDAYNYICGQLEHEYAYYSKSKNKLINIIQLVN